MSDRNCKGCGKHVEEFGMFPGDVCVDCWALTEEANRPITAEELTRMWGG